MPDSSNLNEKHESITGVSKFDPEAVLNEHLFEALKKGLSHFGGEAIVESLLYMLELEHSVDVRKIATNPSYLRTSLVAMFGSGSYVVENKIKDELARQEKILGEGKSLEELIQQLRDEL